METESDQKKKAEAQLQEYKRKLEEEQNKRTREMNNNQQTSDKIASLEKQVSCTKLSYTRLLLRTQKKSCFLISTKNLGFSFLKKFDMFPIVSGEFVSKYLKLEIFCWEMFWIVNFEIFYEIFYVVLVRIAYEVNFFNDLFNLKCQSCVKTNR